MTGSSKWQPYPAYKDSGVEWLGEIPTGWEVKRLKYASSINDEALSETTDPDYEFRYIDIGNVDAVDGIVAEESYRFANAPSRARRVVRNGDVIVSTVRTYLRAIAPIHESDGHFVVSTGFAVVRPRKNNSGYLSYSLRAPFFVDTVVSRSTGVSYPAINAPDVGNIPIPLPSLSEQRAIADYLDRETTRIDALVAKKERQIELLAERRTALISHAVTKGLDPTAPMRDSGIEWLGEIPAGWEVRPLKRTTQIAGRIGFRGYTTDDQVDPGEGALTLGASQITDSGGINTEEAVYISWEKYYESPEIMLRRGDVVVVQRGSCGRVGIIESDLGAVTIKPSLILVRAQKYDERFLFRLLISDISRTYFASIVSSTAVPMLSQEDVSLLVLPLPPLSEQHAIADYLDRETARIDALTEKVRASIDLLREYRTAVISAAVTGKVFVSDE